MNILNKFRSQPERVRKIILWSVVIVLGLSLLTWWVKSIQERLANFESKNFMESLEMPEVETPEIETQELSEELQKLKETLEQIEKNGG